MRFTKLWAWALGQPNRTTSPGSKRRASVVRFAPSLSRLEERTVPNGYIAAGAGAGAPPLVAIRVDKIDELSQGGVNNVPSSGGQLAPTSDGQTDFTTQIFYALPASFMGGVHVATGNFLGDAAAVNGVTPPDWLVTAAGPGGGPDVTVWRTVQSANGNITVVGKVAEWYAFNPNFHGGVNITTGDLDGDGKAELIVAAGAGGGPEVEIYKFGTDGQFHLSTAFYAYNSGFRGGVSVASGQGYDTPFEVRQVINAQIPNGVAFTTPYDDPTTRPGYNATDPNLDFAPFGGNTVIDQQDPFNPFPGPSNTVDANGNPLPYFDIASGVIQYDSANLLNSLNDYVYAPNVVDPTGNHLIPPEEPLVYANWSATSMNPPDFAYNAGIDYGPFVETAPAQGGAPAQITRLTAPNGQVSPQNQLILGAGPGGGPHVRVLSIGTDGTTYGLQVNESLDFYAFDKSYTGGVNVAIGSFVSLPEPDPNGQTVTLNGIQYPAVTPDLATPTLTQVTFPFTAEEDYQFQAQILVTQMHGGQSVVWADYNPIGATGTPSVRTDLSQLNLVPVFLNSQLVFDANNPLNGFYSTQDTTTLANAIDPQYTGNVLDGVSALTFGATNLFSSLAASARAQTMFAVGSSATPSRGTEVKIFDDIGPTGPVVTNGLTSNNPPLDPVDQFYAFTSGQFPNGLGGVAFGFGSLPAPTRDIIELAPIAVSELTDPQLN